MHNYILESMLLGRTMAAQSHDLINVLATIGEAAGLMGDLLNLPRNQGEGLSDPLAYRLDKALASIEAQITRGHRLATDWNTIAHLPDSRMDPNPPGVDLGLMFQLAMRLMARPASQAKVELVGSGATGVLIPVDPQCCLAACLTLLEWALAASPQGNRLEAREHADKAVVELVGFPPLTTQNQDQQALADSAGLVLHEENGRLLVRLMRKI